MATAMALKPKPFPVLQAKFAKNSPEILVGVGIAGIIVSTVLACRATLKAPKVLAEAKENFEMIKLASNQEIQVRDGEDNVVEYTEMDRRQDLVKASVEAAWGFTKLYGIPTIIMAGSLLAIMKGHSITVRRNAALSSAFTTVTAGYKAYRKRVADRYGEEVERDIYYGRHQEKVDGVDENGKKKKEIVNVIDKETFNECSIYARQFDSSNVNWTGSPEMNYAFLKSQENYFNEILPIRKVIMLNEVYDVLGFPRTEEGAVVGWTIYDVAGLENADHRIDFGIRDLTPYERNGEFEDADTRRRETVIPLDFNVDGIVFKLL